MDKITVNANDLVKVYNTRDWELSFSSALPPFKGVILSPHQETRLAYIDVEQQAHTPGSFFYGNDGLGTMAAVRIMDDAIRAMVFGLSKPEEATQEQLDLDFVKELLSISPLTAFEKRLREKVQTDAEKRMLARLAIPAGLNDVTGGAGKKKAIEKHIGYTIIEAEEKDKAPVVTTQRPMDLK